MSISFRPAKRESAPVLVGIAGPSGGGKTYSSLRLARGLAGGKPFAFIDTENGRALHYADYFPEMQHAHLRAPFSPAAYADAIKAADEAGFGVVIVDSMSHEWEGDGGVLRMQEAEFKRLGGRDSAKMLSWVEPKTAHKRMVAELLQVKAHVILDFRAEDKVEMTKDAGGKTVVVPKATMTSIDGWIPICERRLPFELTMSLLVTPAAPGVPRPVKLQEQHRAFFPADRPIDEDGGRALAEWAAGGTSAPADPTPRTDETPPLRDAQGEGAEQLASDRQRRLIFARAKEAGVAEESLRAIFEAATGQTSSAAIPAEKVEAILAAIEAVKPASTFPIPESART